MKLYVAEEHYDYEGFNILGIFDSRVKAEKACIEDADIFSDRTEISEYELNKGECSDL